MGTTKLLEKLRCGEELTLREQALLTIQLSIPAIFAQISSIVMQYIDASMVGHLGADGSAAIGVVASSTWLMGGLCAAASTGFTVQVAQRIGARDRKGARSIVRQGLVAVFLFSCVLMLLGVLFSGGLPVWLGADASICKNASGYFFVYACFLPVLQLNSAAGGMLQCSGNMRLPSMLHIMMCFLDVIFNAVLIFPTREIVISGGAGIKIRIFGA
ncbi:MAG: MATE family efflux transporter, partial [Lachnospiraceae bacterium]|nr:MATE family efflux transporter [Lachnospiraceae bacterium]